MSREISQDFKLLCDFVESYQLKDMTQNNEYINSLKKMHRKLFALITFIVEIDHQNSVGSATLVPNNSILYFQESLSDLGQALFSWLHGGYKPAYLMLRSGIETFLKSIVGINDETVYSEKSMYAILDMAEKAPLFTAHPNSVLFHRIHSCYKELCRYAHTAELSHMSRISALKAFPTFSDSAGKKFADTYSLLVTDMLSFLFIAFNDQFHKAHHRNQANIYSVVPRVIKSIP